ncbi:hypothetical protein LCGC14_2272200, partial [marine sediment metagenome]
MKLFLCCLLVTIPVSAQEVDWGAGVVITANVIGPTESEAIIDAANIVQPTVLRTTEIRPAVETHLTYLITADIGLGP